MRRFVSLLALVVACTQSPAPPADTRLDTAEAPVESDAPPRDGPDTGACSPGANRVCCCCGEGDGLQVCESDGFWSGCLCIDLDSRPPLDDAAEQ
jgi:hypothetical protein